MVGILMVRKQSAYLPSTPTLEELKAGTILENMRLGTVMFFFVERSCALANSTTYEYHLPGAAGCHSGEKPRLGDNKAGCDTQKPVPQCNQSGWETAADRFNVQADEWLSRHPDELADVNHEIQRVRALKPGAGGTGLSTV